MFVKSIGKSAGRIGHQLGRIGLQLVGLDITHQTDMRILRQACRESPSSLSQFIWDLCETYMNVYHEPWMMTLFLESGLQVGLQIWISQSGKTSTNILVLFTILALEVVESCGHLPCAEDWGETLAPAHDTIPIMCAMGPKPMVLGL